MKRVLNTAATLGVLLALAGPAAAQTADQLPSWNDGPVKSSIIAFVAKVTNRASPDFVPPGERIATFDNDGTLWAEQPMYFQLLFALYVHHTDGDREWAYDRTSSIGRLDKGLDEARAKGWAVVDMKRD